MRDPYIVLGVPRSASLADIKKAYRKLAKKLHPDHNPDDAQVAERFKEISAAYHILGDEKLKARYDRGEIDASGAERAPAGFRQSYAHAGGAGGPFEGFTVNTGHPEADDLFAELFGNLRRGGGAGPRRPMRSRGSDQQFTLRVGFLEAARGSTRRVTLPSGKTLDVRIPSGIGDGQQIRLRQQGEPGFGGGPAGDVLIEVRVDPHSFFTRKDNDIHVEIPVTLTEAVLGAKITVPTVDGMVSLTVPKGANSGITLRLKGRGMADRPGSPRGDQYVKLKVMLPDGSDPELERFVESWPGRNYEVRGRYQVD